VEARLLEVDVLPDLVDPPSEAAAASTILSLYAAVSMALI
jgi:hypothetical protein